MEECIGYGCRERSCTVPSACIVEGGKP